jgi:hypothetical protein
VLQDLKYQHYDLPSTDERQCDKEKLHVTKPPIPKRSNSRNDWMILSQILKKKASEMTKEVSKLPENLITLFHMA